MSISKQFTGADVKSLFLKAFLFLCPVFYVTSINLRESQEMFFKVMAMALLCLFWENFWLSAFMLLNIALFFYNGGMVGAEYILNIFFAGCLFLLAKKYFQKNDFMRYRGVFLWLLAINILFMILQYFNIDPVFTSIDNLNRISPEVVNYNLGVFGLKAINSMFLAFMIPILMSFNILLAIPVFYLLFVCKSSAGMMSGITVFLFTLYFRSKKLFAVCLLLGVLGGIGYVYFDNRQDSLTFNSRFTMWHLVIKKAFQNPIGYGPDSFRNTNLHKNFQFAADSKYRNGTVYAEKNGTTSFEYYGINGKYPDLSSDDDKDLKNGVIDVTKLPGWDNAHNEYIQLFFEAGILGLVFLFFFFKEITAIFYNLPKDKETVMLFGCLLSYFVSGITQFPMHLARIGCFFPIILGAFYAKHKLNQGVLKNV